MPPQHQESNNDTVESPQNVEKVRTPPSSPLTLVPCTSAPPYLKFIYHGWLQEGCLPTEGITLPLG